VIMSGSPSAPVADDGRCLLPLSTAIDACR
jgi:hypothetical protein